MTNLEGISKSMAERLHSQRDRDNASSNALMIATGNVVAALIAKHDHITIDKLEEVAKTVYTALDMAWKPVKEDASEEQ